eukprot:CAMPEP_0170620828 /NCGR_PEP_ID=MMETSP0224-20130122/28271_1 /TAXON_ID=285029 /ORGANISM="Togula jolla, Strain CCCM 725" /LENGTH=469 /DNA_ID=CAMNT_0010947037 /DNA_START=161 /DNA_END=1567 /DNA_ORIENTATION=+
MTFVSASARVLALVALVNFAAATSGSHQSGSLFLSTKRQASSWTWLMAESDVVPNSTDEAASVSVLREEASTSRRPFQWGIIGDETTAQPAVAIKTWDKAAVASNNTSNNDTESDTAAETEAPVTNETVEAEVANETVEAEVADVTVAQPSSPEMFPSDMSTALGSVYKGQKPVVLVGLGYQKCGTTMMSDMLSFHPDAVHYRAKEKHYLVGLALPHKVTSHKQYLLGLEREAELEGLQDVSECAAEGPPSSLQQYFDDCFGGQVPGVGQATLDLTPSYGTKRDVDALMNTVKLLDQGEVDFRFIAAIREPVARAVSATGMQRKIGKGKFANMSDEALDHTLLHEVETREKEVTIPPRAITDGEYEEALSRFLESYPKESVLVVNNEQLNNVTTWKRIYQHIGLTVPSEAQIMEWNRMSNDIYLKTQTEKYAASQTEHYQASDDVVTRLKGHYAPRDEALWTLLGTPRW